MFDEIFLFIILNMSLRLKLREEQQVVTGALLSMIFIKRKVLQLFMI